FSQILLGEDTNISLNDTRELLIETCDLEPVLQDEIIYLVSKGASIFVFEVSELGKELCNETFGFIPNIKIHYDHVQLGKYAYESNSTLYRVCGVLLKELYCDLVMLANGEVAYVLRINGETFCDDANPIIMDYATKILFDEMEIDFTFKKLPRK
ncbi:SitI3 family protein, partial [uncultured Gimesia sp.]|uniref:SitI3 family protein n=1 Tax=uncultured Gimesia sp. TaxID=1678688 RepID=UPI0026292771